MVVDGPGQRDRLRPHFGAHLPIDERRRRLLDHFLMAALDRAFTLPQIDRVPVSIRKHLDFDMTRLGDELFDEYPVIAEARLRLAARTLESVSAFLIIVGNAHSLTATAGAGFEHHRIADARCDLHRFIGIR